MNRGCVGAGIKLQDQASGSMECRIRKSGNPDRSGQGSRDMRYRRGEYRDGYTD